MLGEMTDDDRKIRLDLFDANWMVWGQMKLASCSEGQLIFRLSIHVRNAFLAMALLLVSVSPTRLQDQPAVPDPYRQQSEEWSCQAKRALGLPVPAYTFR